MPGVVLPSLAGGRRPELMSTGVRLCALVASHFACDCVSADRLDPVRHGACSFARSLGCNFSTRMLNNTRATLTNVHQQHARATRARALCRVCTFTFACTPRVRPCALDGICATGDVEYGVRPCARTRKYLCSWASVRVRGLVVGIGLVRGRDGGATLKRIQLVPVHKTKTERYDLCTCTHTARGECFAWVDGCSHVCLG